MANEIGWGKAANNDIGWGAFPINDNIGIDLISKFQYRGDLDKRIFEGQIGITYKFNDGR